MSNTTLWIDVTMLINWSGKMTGIQRVEYNLARRFSQQPNVKFFVFDKSANRLIDFDFKHIEFKIASQQEATEPTAIQAAAEPLAGSKELKSKVPLQLKKILKPMYHRARGYAAKIKNSLREDDRKDAAIASGDTILILSGDWSDRVFVTLMGSYKEKLGLKVVQVVYDMLPWAHPGYFIEGMPKQFSDYMKKALPISDQVLSISESTKKDINKFIKENDLPRVKIDVFRLGDDFVLSNPEKPAGVSEKLGKGFLLTVGTVEARKNHQLILDAYSLAQKKKLELPTLVIAGKKGWLVENFMNNLDKNQSVRDKFVFLQPTDSELAWLYKNCQFTVFPSIYEGWGLPVAESLFNGKLSLSSNSSSMPEIAGDMIDYFSPNSAEELLAKITLYLSDKDALAQKERLIASYKPTSWDESFRQVKRLVLS
jgi:glycosyltransferase involved in cell wall biosynthesis